MGTTGLATGTDRWELILAITMLNRNYIIDTHKKKIKSFIRFRKKKETHITLLPNP